MYGSFTHLQCLVTFIILGMITLTLNGLLCVKESVNPTTSRFGIPKLMVRNSEFKGADSGNQSAQFGIRRSDFVIYPASGFQFLTLDK